MNKTPLNAKYVVIALNQYTEIRDRLRKRTEKLGFGKRFVLPYLPPYRILCLDEYKEMKPLLSEYAELFFTEDDENYIEDLHGEMDELEDEIANLHGDMGDIERKIENYPLKDLKWSDNELWKKMTH